MEKKNALHSLLAVESDLRNVGKKVLTEAVNTFNKKDDHFDGLVKVYEALNEENSYTNTSEEKKIITTVADKLNYVKDPVAKAINALVSKEETNASGTAKAPLKVGDFDFGEVSATSLLALEKEMVNVRQMYASIPTLDPVKPWKRNEMEEGHKYTTEPVKTMRTQKQKDFVVVYEATKEHPAQVEEVTKDIVIGTYNTTYMSGKLTPLAKSQLLAKVDMLIQAIKKARSKANEAEVVTTDIGTKIFDFINGQVL